MKKLSLIFLVFTISTFGQLVNSVKFSPFVNFGSYDNNTSSASFSVYSSLNLFNYDYLTLGFDQLKIDNNLFQYEQSLYVAGYTKNLYPFYLSFNYGYLSGDYSDALFVNNYGDDINIYNGKITFNTNLFFLSGSYSYLNIRGIKTLLSKQAEAGLIYVPSVKLSFGAAVINTNQSDQRNLVGSEFFASYKPSQKVTLIGSVFVGERAYSFDPNLFTIFNQDETQKGNYKFQIDYSVNQNLSISGVYQHSAFTGYRINYISLGLSYLIKT